MWCGNVQQTDAEKPTLDQNAGTPKVPADIAQKTPAFIERLIQELDETRNRRSEIFAEKYGQYRNGTNTPPAFGQKGYKSRVIRDQELDKEDAMLSEKEGSLQRQLQDMRTTVLMAPTDPDEVELENNPPVAEQSKGFNRNANETTE